jgi:hypothetical protein
VNIFEFRCFFNAVVYAAIVYKMFRRICVNLFQRPSAEINIRK